MLPMWVGLMGAATSVAVGVTTSSESSIAPLRVDGIIAAVYSPFDANGALNTSVVAARLCFRRREQKG